MNIVAATTAYEDWAGRRIDLIDRDIALKHRDMRADAFSFLRATFYRWCVLWHDACSDLATAPKLLAVGDLHVENFGTWRDAEARLVWGINDFDEACAMPYTIDLVRLATSAVLAGREEKLSIGARAAADAILDAYTEAIGEDWGVPFILEGEHPRLRAMVLGEDRSPVRFWAKLQAQQPDKPPRAVRAILQRRLPREIERLRFKHRIAGLGSLGRPRYVAIAETSGGLIAREAKAMLPSAYGWAMKTGTPRLFYNEIIARAARSADPYLAIEKGWLLRRLAPHCNRIELDDVPTKKNEEILLAAMGRETANIHFGSPSALAAVRRDLKKRPKNWLYDAATRMADATLKDWKAWRKA